MKVRCVEHDDLTYRPHQAIVWRSQLCRRPCLLPPA
jgi:hypothetical protein